MNSIIMWIGIAIALALSAAFAAPFFIDWGGQRGFFEARASAILGRTVEFAGPLEVRLVPFPSLHARDVRIGEGAEPDGEGADEVVFRAALAPLLSGELRISEMRLVAPRLTLVRDERGRIELASQRADTELPVPAERTSIDRLEIVDGSFTLDDAPTGGRYQVSGLNLTGSAGSLAGPFRAEGGGSIGDVPHTLRLATGRLQDNGTIRVTGSVVPADRPISFDVDGTLDLSGGDVAYRGGVTMARIDTGDGRYLPWRFNGQVSATPAEAEFERLSLQIGPADREVSFTGDAVVDLGSAPRFEAALSTRQIDLDRLTGTDVDPAVTPAGALAGLATVLDADAFPLPGRIALDIASVVTSGNLVEAVEADIEIGAGRWSIGNLSALLPGRTDAGLSGEITFGPAGPRLDGALLASSQQAGALAGWLAGPDTALPGLSTLSGRLDASASLSLDVEGLEIDGFDIETAGALVGGSLSYAPGADGAHPRLALRLQSDRLDLGNAAALRAGPVHGALLGVLGGVEIDLDIDAATLVVGAVEARGVEVAVAAGGGDIRVERLTVADLGGARIEGEGALRDVASEPEGTLRLSLDADALDALGETLMALGFDRASDVLRTRGPELVPARLELTLEASRSEAEEGSRGELSLSGEAGGTTLDLSLGFDGRVDAPTQALLDMAFEAANEDGTKLLRQLGIDGLASEEPGRVALSGQGRPADAMAFELDVAGMGVAGTVEGHARFTPRGGRDIVADVALDVPRLDAVLELAGVVLPSGGGSAWLETHLSAVDDVVRLSDFSLMADGTAIQGTMGIDLGGTERVVDGRLTVQALDLPWLLAALLGPDAFEEAGTAAWPEGAFAPVSREGWRGRIHVDAPALLLGGPYALSEGSLEVDFDQGRVSLSRMAGLLAGGRVAGDVDLFTSEGSVRLDGRMELAEAALGELVWRTDERPVASGLMSGSVEVSGEGRSLLGLVSTLSGEGSFEVEDGVVRRLNARAFDQIVQAADGGLTLDEGRVREVFAGHLDAGSLSFRRAAGALSVASGVVRGRNVRLDTDQLDSFASVVVDLTEMGIDSEWTLRVASGEDDGRTREVGIVFAGPLEAPERSIDVNPLLGYLTVRAFEQEVRRLEELQAEILERERLGRELMRMGEDRRRREREAAEAEVRAAADAEAEALRRAEEAEAEAEARRQAEEAEAEARRQVEEAEAEARREEGEAEARRRAEEEAVERRREEEERQRRSEEISGDALPANDELRELIEDVLRRLPADGAPRQQPFPEIEVVPLEPPGQAAPPTTGAPLDITPPPPAIPRRFAPTARPPAPPPAPSQSLGDPSRPVN